eukprot:6135598-Lingulodinium_polyedra.AAC.1
MPSPNSWYSAQGIRVVQRPRPTCSQPTHDRCRAAGRRWGGTPWRPRGRASAQQRGSPSTV